jgi:hypothetical protein
VSAARGDREAWLRAESPFGARGPFRFPGGESPPERRAALDAAGAMHQAFVPLFAFGDVGDGPHAGAHPQVHEGIGYVVEFLRARFARLAQELALYPDGPASREEPDHPVHAIGEVRQFALALSAYEPPAVPEAFVVAALTAAGYDFDGVEEKVYALAHALGET